MIKNPIPESYLPITAIGCIVLILGGAIALWYMPSNVITLSLAIIWLVAVVILTALTAPWYTTLSIRQNTAMLAMFVALLGGGPGTIVAHLGALTACAGPLGMVAVAPARHHTGGGQDELTNFCAMLFGRSYGWVNLRYCPGDPTNDELVSGGWFELPAQRAELESRARSLADQHGDVYITRAMYSARKVSAAKALPTRVLFVDDAPSPSGGGAPLPYSAVVRTGEGLPQAWYMLDREIPGDAAERIQRRIAYQLGADTSGWDITQVVRLPIGYNTKSAYAAPVPVEIVDCTGAVYSCDEIAAAYPAQADAAAEHAAPGSLADAELDYWRGNLHILLNANGMPRRARNTDAPGYRYASGKYALDIDRRSGIVPLDRAGNIDTSAMRYSVAVWLMRLGYPDAEWWALMEHLADFGATQSKGTTWLQRDLARLLDKVKSCIGDLRQTPTRASTGAGRPPAALVVVDPPRRGRPAALTTDQHMALLESASVGRGPYDGRLAMLSLDECAVMHGVSRSTVERIERKLRRDRALIRHTSPDRRESYVEVFGGVKIDSNPPESDHHGMVSGGIFDATESPIGVQDSGVPHACMRGVHTPPTLPAEPADPGTLAAAQPADPGTLAAAQPADPGSAGSVGGVCTPPATVGASFTPPAARSDSGSASKTPLRKKLRQQERQRERIRGMSLRELERELRVLSGAAEKSRKDSQRRALEIQRAAVEREIGQRRHDGIRAMYAAADKSPEAPPLAVELPTLPPGWAWAWLPSTAMHQAYCVADRDVRTRVYHESELGRLLAEAYQLARQRSGVNAA